MKIGIKSYDVAMEIKQKGGSTARFASVAMSSSHGNVG